MANVRDEALLTIYLILLTNINFSPNFTSSFLNLTLNSYLNEPLLINSVKRLIKQLFKRGKIMMKTKLFIVAFAMSLMFGTFSAQALCPGCTGGVVVGPDDDIIEFGSFSVRVKWVDPHYGPDGRYYTYSYLTLTGTTMAYCQQQVNAVMAGGNVTVVQPCQAD